MASKVNTIAFRQVAGMLLLILPLASAPGCGKTNQSRQAPPAVSPEGFSLSAGQLFQVKSAWVQPLRSGGDGSNQVSLSFLTAGGATPATVAVLEFHPRMPNMGNHGTDEETQAFQPGSRPATVLVTGIYFNMPGAAGEWVVTVKATVDDRSDELKLAVPEVL